MPQSFAQKADGKDGKAIQQPHDDRGKHHAQQQAELEPQPVKAPQSLRRHIGHRQHGQGRQKPTHAGRLVVQEGKQPDKGKDGGKYLAEAPFRAHWRVAEVCGFLQAHGAFVAETGGYGQAAG